MWKSGIKHCNILAVAIWKTTKTSTVMGEKNKIATGTTKVTFFTVNEQEWCRMIPQLNAKNSERKMYSKLLFNWNLKTQASHIFTNMGSQWVMKKHVILGGRAGSLLAVSTEVKKLFWWCDEIYIDHFHLWGKKWVVFINATLIWLEQKLFGSLLPFLFNLFFHHSVLKVFSSTIPCDSNVYTTKKSLKRLVTFLNLIKTCKYLQSNAKKKSHRYLYKALHMNIHKLINTHRSYSLFIH